MVEDPWIDALYVTEDGLYRVLDVREDADGNLTVYLLEDGK